MFDDYNEKAENDVDDEQNDKKQRRRRRMGPV